MEIQEYLDVFDDNMRYLCTATREAIHQKGYWHQTFHCWLIRRHNGKQYVLFQRRGPRKLIHPNKFDITAAGHLTAGETPRDGIRELNEELGLSMKFEDLVPLGIRYDVESIGPVTNREFSHVYLLENNILLDAYKLQPDEVTGLIQVELYDGMKLFADQVESVPISGVLVDKKGIKQLIETTLSKEDILPRIDGYYMKIFIMAERYFQGNPYLAI